MADESPGKPKAPRHVIADWLTLHSLSADDCRRILARSDYYHDGSDGNAKSVPVRNTGLDAAAAWRLAADALAAFFPAGRETIERVWRNTGTDFPAEVARGQRPFTLNDGGNGYPYVRCRYRQRVSDLVILQHEFSHAVQIVASRETFMPPVLRECCAFIGELALLDFLKTQPGSMQTDAEAVWRAQTARIFRKHQPALEAALDAPGTGYDYNWNYPVARILAIETSHRLTRDQAWELFSGDVELSRVYDWLELS